MGGDDTAKPKQPSTTVPTTPGVAPASLGGVEPKALAEDPKGTEAGAAAANLAKAPDAGVAVDLIPDTIGKDKPKRPRGNDGVDDSGKTPTADKPGSKTPVAKTPVVKDPVTKTPVAKDPKPKDPVKPDVKPESKTPGSIDEPKIKDPFDTAP